MPLGLATACAARGMPPERRRALPGRRVSVGTTYAATSRERGCKHTLRWAPADKLARGRFSTKAQLGGSGGNCAFAQTWDHGSSSGLSRCYEALFIAARTTRRSSPTKASYKRGLRTAWREQWHPQRPADSPARGAPHHRRAGLSAEATRENGNEKKHRFFRPPPSPDGGLESCSLMRAQAR
jgi:hypothetical protein